RFSQALGFEGYPELQQAAIEEYRNRADDQNGGGQLFDFDHSEFESSLGADHANVEETARSLTREQVEACVSALASAQRVMIVGVDQMAFFASYLRHLLALLDMRAEVVASPRQDSITRLSRVDESTLVIAFSAGRAHALIVRAMKLARHRRAHTLSISDATLSEVGEHAELTLYYSSNSPSFTRSNAALLAVVQALAYGVYARATAAFNDRIRAAGGVARMASPRVIKEIQEAVTIPVMAKARIGHFAEAQVLQSLQVDYVDESEVLTLADEAHHIDKHAFEVPFVCGATNLGE